MNDMKEKCALVLRAFKMSDYYRRLMDEEEETDPPRFGVYRIGDNGSVVMGVSGKGKSRLPAVLKEQADLVKKEHPIIAQTIASAIESLPAGTDINSLGDDWLESEVIPSLKE